MMTLVMKVYDLRNGSAEELYLKLRKRNSMELKEVTETVGEILANVKDRGDTALLEYTQRFDGVKLERDRIRVRDEEIDRAYRETDQSLLKIIRKAAKNIRDFHELQKEKSWFTAEPGGVILGQLIRPLKLVGVYVPGGTAPLVSSVLMNIIPAKAAGVKKIIMATPPMKDGSVSPAMLAAAREAGADEIYRVGGAQAIGAMAFGTETVPRVEKIVGPGNIYVATAKRLVFGCCDIDMFAGPSEIVIVADDSANPVYVAADLLSQAEHDLMASAVLVTMSERMAEEVCKELERQKACLSRRDIIEKSLKEYGAIVIVNGLEEAIDVVNAIAPEHLELCVAEPFSLLGDTVNAGAIFLGNYSSEPLGDYFAGPNHVLPTGGTARFFSPLNLSDFMKKSSIVYYTREALGKVKDDVTGFAEAEGLIAHSNAIRVRFE